VEYRPGKLNGAVDALSRCDEDTATVHAISVPTFQVFDTLRAEAASDNQVLEVWEQLKAGKAKDGWSEMDGLLWFKGKKILPDASTTWPDLLADAHDGGHEGVQKTIHRWRASFYNPHAL
jgi:hypothetical protein